MAVVLAAVLLVDPAQRAAAQDNREPLVRPPPNGDIGGRSVRGPLAAVPLPEGTYDLLLGREGFEEAGPFPALMSVDGQRIQFFAHIGLDSSFRLSGVVTLGRLRLRGHSILEGDIVVAQELMARARRGPGDTVLEGTTRIHWGKEAQELSVLLRRPPEGVPESLSGVYDVTLKGRFHVGPASDRSLSLGELGLSLDVDRSGEGRTDATTLVDVLGETQTFAPGECMVSPAGGVDCLLPSSPLRSPYSGPRLHLSGRLAEGPAGGGTFFLGEGGYPFVRGDFGDWVLTRRGG